MRDGVEMKEIAKIIRYMKRAKILVLSLLFSLNIYSEVPVEITYQGNIREKGILISGERNMSFSLYDSTSSTVPLWSSTPTPSAVSISTGVFRVTLKPEIPRDKWNEVLYLEITVEGQKLSPREKITPSVLAINSLLHEGKRYYTSILPPSEAQGGDLWFNSNTGVLYYYNGSGWTTPSGVPAPHHTTHEPGGGDEITRLGAITFTNDIIISSNTLIRPGVNVSSITISTNVSIEGWLNVKSGGTSSSDMAQIWRDSSGVIIGSMSATGVLMANKFLGDASGLSGIATLSNVDPYRLIRANSSKQLVNAGILQGDGINDGITVDASSFSVVKTALFMSSVTIQGDGTTGLIVSNGNVGIGTTNPKTKLDVVGDDVSGSKVSSYYAGDKEIAYFKRK